MTLIPVAVVVTTAPFAEPAPKLAPKRRIGRAPYPDKRWFGMGQQLVSWGAEMQASLAAGASVNAQYEQLACSLFDRAAAKFNGRPPVSTDGRCRCTPGLKVQRRQTRAPAVLLAHRHLLGPPYPRVRDKCRPSCSPALVCPAPASVGLAQRQGRSLAAEQEPITSNQRTPQFSGVHFVNPLHEVMPRLSLPPDPNSRAVMRTSSHCCGI